VLKSPLKAQSSKLTSFPTSRTPPFLLGVSHRDSRVKRAVAPCGAKRVRKAYGGFAAIAAQSAKKISKKNVTTPFWLASLNM